MCREMCRRIAGKHLIAFVSGRWDFQGSNMAERSEVGLQ